MNDRKSMTIVGFGRMGRKFAEIFTSNFDVQVISSRDVKNDVEKLGAKLVQDYEEAIARSDYIFVAVPIYALDKVVERINQFVKPDTTAIDICSAKVAAEEKLSRLKCKHFGIHNNAIIGSPDSAIIEYLNNKGYDLQAMTAEEHDKQNSVIGLAHFIGMVLNSYLGSEERATLRKSKAGTFLLQLIEHLRANSPVTYWETQTQNPHMARYRAELLKAFQEYDDRLSKGQLTAREIWTSK